MTQPRPRTDDEVFNAHNDTADEIVGDVVPDAMPSADVAVRDEDGLADLEPDKDATDVHGRPLFDEDGDEQWYYEDRDWPHQFVEFRGDMLAVRKPQKQALSAFSLAASKHVKVKTQNDLTGLFIERHLSETTYDRVFSRMMDPDDEGYDVKSIGELMGKIVRLSTGDKGEKLTEKAQDVVDEYAGDTSK